MRLLVRADASGSGGAGHLVRGLSLVQSARALGHEVALAGSAGGVAWLREALQQDGVTVLAPPSWQELPSWAGAEGFDAVHVDSYDAPADLADGCERSGVVLSSIEDGRWGRRRAHVVTDPSFGDQARDGVLAGPSYLLLRADVRRGRLAVADRARAQPGAALDVVVVLGGTDASGALPSVLGALTTAGRAAGLLLRVRAVAGGVGRLLPASDGVEVEPLAPGPQVVAAMAAADLVVTAAGTTTGEVCCLGVPMAALPVVDNQIPGYRALVRAGLAFGLGRDDAPGLGPAAADVVAVAVADADARERTAAQAARVVDGSGAARLVRALELACGGRPPAPPALTARYARRVDSASQLAWRNDPLVRSASQTSHHVGEDEHARWFEAVLASTTRHLLVVEDDAAQPVASVRWDADDARAHWEVSIMLAPHHRGRGWGAAVLASAEERLLTDEPRATRLVAQVAPDNSASLSMFQCSGYALEDRDRAGGPERLVKLVRARPS